MNAVAALLVLFSGHDLEGWNTLAGAWSVRNGAMVCVSAPASIRTSWEADHFVLTFGYRRSDCGVNRVAVYSKMTTGGHLFTLGPRGILLPGVEARSVDPCPADEWIDARIEVTAEGLYAVCTRKDGRPLSEVSIGLDAISRGFLRFDASEPGLEVRDVHVVEVGFKSMFDGSTLEGWEAVRAKDPDDPGWSVGGGAITCRGHRSSWLRTLRTYDDFVLRLEYKLPPRGNSGIFLRAPIEGRVSRNGLEIQLLDDVPDRGRIKPCEHTGSVYDGIAPEVQVPTPVNQWNAIEIYLKGKRIRTTVNGIEIYDARLDNAEIDANSHFRPLTTRRTVGFLGLQDHSTPVSFRNVRIWEME